MFRRVLISTLLLVALSSCNMIFAVPGDGVPGGPTTDPQLQIGQAVTQTFVAQTQIALAVQQTMASVATNTPSVTPSPTFTFTPDVLRVTVSVETNCRSGPGLPYEILGVLPVGQSAEVVGRNASGDTWIIRLPSNPAIICWLWGQYATVTGNTAGLTVYTPPPTPTPPATFSVVYLETISCGQYAFRFNITNNGSVTWQSINLTITDNTTAAVFIHTLDEFRSYNGCILEIDQQDLTPGETGPVANVNPGQLGYDPAGHSFTAVFKLCSENGLAGTCVEKTLSFNP